MEFACNIFSVTARLIAVLYLIEEGKFYIAMSVMSIKLLKKTKQIVILL